MRIFNHDIMTCTNQQVIGNHLYSARALGLTSPGDTIQLHPDLRPEWDSIVAHYARVGLPHSHDVVWNVSLDLISDTVDCRPSVFYFGDSADSHSAVAERFRAVDRAWSDVVALMNSKNNFMALARELGVPVPQTNCYESKGAAADRERISFPCFLKPAVSVDGKGIMRCENPQELHRCLDNLPEDVPYQVQEEVLASSFLNLQYSVGPEGLQRLACTEQILDGCSHSGNRFPSVVQPWDTVEPMARWMADQGMREVFAFDVAVVGAGEGADVLAIECNPRYNGASYPTVIANRLGIECWSSETFTTSHHALKDIDLSGLEFDAALGRGVIVVNWGTVSLGRLAILLSGSPQTQRQLRDSLRERLFRQ